VSPRSGERRALAVVVALRIAKKGETGCSRTEEASGAAALLRPSGRNHTHRKYVDEDGPERHQSRITIHHLADPVIPGFGSGQKNSASPLRLS
jgi:hypothetical protein